MRRSQFATAIFKLPAFVRFIEILSERGQTGCSQLELGRRLRERLGVGLEGWTSQTNAKIMLDWARHLRLAPGVFAEHPRKRQRNEALRQRDPTL